MNLKNTKKETRGRKSLPPDKKKPPQATVKINDFILPFVQELKSNLKKDLVTKEILVQLFAVLRGEGDGEQQISAFKDPDAVRIVADLQEKIRMLEAENQIIKTNQIKQQEISLNLAQERDKVHLNAVHNESKLESLKSSYRLLKHDYDALLHREYDCMALKANGERCSKPAKLDVNQNGLMIRVCLQHKKVT